MVKPWDLSRYSISHRYTEKWAIVCGEECRQHAWYQNTIPTYPWCRSCLNEAYTFGVGVWVRCELDMGHVVKNAKNRGPVRSRIAIFPPVDVNRPPCRPPGIIHQNAMVLLFGILWEIVGERVTFFHIFFLELWLADPQNAPIFFSFRHLFQQNGWVTCRRFIGDRILSLSLSFSYFCIHLFYIYTDIPRNSIPCPCPIWIPLFLIHFWAGPRTDGRTRGVQGPMEKSQRCCCFKGEVCTSPRKAKSQVWE